MGAWSGAATAGIGGVIGGVSMTTGMGILKELGRAGAHATVSGLTSMAGEGKFWQGAATGAISSFTGSLTHNLPIAAQIGASTIAGGITSKISGGEFWKGAVTGFAVSTFNHAMHAVSEKINYRETLAKYNNLVKNVNGNAGKAIDLAKYFTKDQLVWLVKAGKISSWVGWGTIGLDAGLAVEAYYNGTPWGEHAYNAALGLIGKAGIFGRLTANSIDFYVRAGKFFMNTVNTINTEGNRMLMDYMKFLYTGF
jgi:hypothetical protein